MELILIIAKHDLSGLGTVRTIPDLHVAELKEELWLRYTGQDIAHTKELRKLPVIRMFHLKDDQLFPPHAHTPVASMETLDWKSLSEFLPIELPLSAIPGKTEARVQIRLVVSSLEQKEEAMMTNLGHWKQFAENTPEVRLQSLSFAASEHGQVFIVGSPLPPIPGKAYWSREGIYIPCGFDFEFRLMAELLHEKMNLLEEYVLIFTEEEKLLSIAAEYFVPASRSSIRLTKGGVHE